MDYKSWSLWKKLTSNIFRPVCCQLVKPCTWEQRWRVVDFLHRSSQRWPKGGVNWVEDPSNPRREGRPCLHPLLTEEQQEKRQENPWQSHHFHFWSGLGINSLFYQDRPGTCRCQIITSTVTSSEYCLKTRNWPQPKRISHLLGLILEQHCFKRFPRKRKATSVRDESQPLTATWSFPPPASMEPAKPRRVFPTARTGGEIVRTQVDFWLVMACFLDAQRF